MSELYNAEFKEQFLSQYPEQTQKTFRNAFSKATSTEKLLEKDLYDFTQTEIGKVIKNAKPLNIGVVKSISRYFATYISWAMENRKSNIHPLKGVDKDWYNQFVDKTNKIHFSHDELFSPDGILEHLENAQDQAFLSLMFCGILGQSFIELQLLHYNHINWNTNEIKVHDEKGYNRTITVDDQIMRYVKNAYQQQVYRTIKEDGEFTEKELLKTDYIFQAVKSPRVKEGDPVSQASLYNRIKNVKNETEITMLTPNSLRQSGMIYECYRLIKEKIERGEEPKITYQDVWKPIGEKYNYAMFDNGGEWYYNSTLMREYISIENLHNLYNLDVTM